MNMQLYTVLPSFPNIEIIIHSLQCSNIFLTKDQDVRLGKLILAVIFSGTSPTSVSKSLKLLSYFVCTCLG